MQNVSQWKTTSASFINTWSFMSLLDNHQLKMVGDGWWLTSNDMKIEVLIKEALVVFHWLIFCIVYIARFCVFFLRGVYIVKHYLLVVFVVYIFRFCIPRFYYYYYYHYYQSFCVITSIISNEHITQ